MLRIPYQELFDNLLRVLLKLASNSTGADSGQRAVTFGRSQNSRIPFSHDELRFSFFHFGQIPVVAPPLTVEQVLN